MEAKITFAELEQFVRNNYGKDLTFSRLSEGVLGVTYKQNMVFTSLPVTVNLKVEKIDPSSITLSYSAKLGLSNVIDVVIEFLKIRIPELSDAIKREKSHLVIIDLAQIEQTKTIFEKIALNSLAINDDNLTMGIILL